MIEASACVPCEAYLDLTLSNNVTEGRECDSGIINRHLQIDSLQRIKPSQKMRNERWYV